MPRSLNPRSKLWLLGTLMVLSATVMGCSYSSQPDARTVYLKMRYSTFVPGHLELKKGETVEFVITNTDPIDHEFILGDEVVQQRHETGTEAQHGAIPTEVSVPARSTVRTRVTLAGAGELIIGCHLPRHYGYGMKASVKVTA